ncbi:MAG: ABC transporter ATP-binding protein [Chloroflexi bacterium]|nr:ABC transporter ATP-binding protein [Chloroflexota bacterium]
MTNNASPSPLLRVTDLRLSYAGDRGDVRAVDGVSFDVRSGETLALVGESGSGKTSLALALLRVLPRNVARYSGSVILAGQEVMTLNDEAFRERVRWRQISMVFQGATESMNPVFKVGFQIAEPFLSRTKMSKRDAHVAARRLLDLVKLPPETFDRYPHELSGGMKQRAAIATALALEPSLVILDEPTSALDVGVQAQIMNLFKRLKRDLGLSTLFITHDIALASDLADSIGVMYAGEIVEMGPSEEILERPAHPYTQKLLAAIPRLHSDAPLEFIPGEPPDLADPPSGCRFHTRCRLAWQRCSEEAPPSFPSANGLATAKCWLLAPTTEDPA